MACFPDVADATRNPPPDLGAEMPLGAGLVVGHSWPQRSRGGALRRVCGKAVQVALGTAGLGEDWESEGGQDLYLLELQQLGSGLIHLEPDLIHCEPNLYFRYYGF